MSLDAIVKPPAALGAGRRFFVTGYLPTLAALLFLLLLIWAGARGWAAPAGGHLSFRKAWETAADLKAGD
ncbi:hypothetical protein [Streptomyces sp. A1547]|uniref:hypothetical protein n=1 Tax=Streptomyces sp. A1547 TaxID=2563105 RepID=UPI00109EA0EE|nr:hypothetical protein [Streptomyces sp. A1547]THA30047.1 hypothetical protein E6W17_38580 [Streptomyces sp. A1547]